MNGRLERLGIAERLLLSSLALAFPIAGITGYALSGTWSDLSLVRREEADLAVVASGKEGGGALRLDSEPDSAALSVVVLDGIPLSEALLGRLSGLASQAAPKGRLAPADREPLLGVVSALEKEGTRSTVGAGQTALREDAGSYGESPSLQKRLPPAIERWNASLRALRAAVTADDPAAVVRETAAARASAAALHETAVAELGRLLEIRAGALTRRLVVVLLLMLVAAAIAVRHVQYILGGISRPMGRVAETARLVASGDLAKARHDAGEIVGSGAGGEDPGRNEIRLAALAVREMTASLTALLVKVRDAGAAVEETAGRIAARARELEATAVEQAASTQEVSATSREIARRAASLSQTMADVDRGADATAHLAGEGQQGLAEMGASMSRLTDATSAVSARLAAIRGKADGIGAIVTTITRVAEQTNLLSLNAAIEAEKAGEAGKGFAVVAREIRRLADRTAAAAVDIGEMVRGMRSVVTSGVMEMDRFVEQVQEGEQQVRKAGERLAAIIDEVRSLTPRFREVTDAMSAQTEGADQISEAMAQLSSAASATRDSLLEFGQVTSRLGAASGDLSREVSRFRLEASPGPAEG